MSGPAGSGRDGWGERFYRHRGLVPVLPLLYLFWAADPREPWLAAGLALMAAGEAVRTWGAAHLGMTARSSRPRAGKLVTHGPFAHTRHPLYWGNFALAVGFALASGAGRPWFPVLVAGGFVLLYAGHARREEATLARAFPDAFAAYRREVPAWRWRLRAGRAAPAGEASPPSWRRAARVEALTWNAEFWLLVGLWLRVRLGGS